jgi:hypothetical protein
MKKGIITVLLLLTLCMLFNCSVSQDFTENEEITVNVDPIEGIDNEIQFALYDGNNLRYYDGENLILVNTGSVRPAGKRKISIEDVIYYFDEFGNSLQSKWLPAIPEAILSVESKSGIPAKGTIVYNDDVYTLEDIPPAEAYALGALYKHYTKIYENSVNINTWYLDQWQVKEVIQTLSGHIIAIDTTGHFHNLTDSINSIDTAINDGIMLYDMGTEHGYIADDSGIYEITWSMNFFDHAEWQLVNGIWTTENGYTWTHETGVISNANTMYCWNEKINHPAEYKLLTNDMPYLIPAGVREENGEQVSYWLELVTGNLYRHIPSIDRLDFIVQLFEGPYDRALISDLIDTVKPEMIGDCIYFHHNATIKKYDIITTMISTFSEDQELIPWN